MELIRVIADLFGTLGMMGFLFAEIKQLHKVYTTKHTTALSMTHYRLKLFAVTCSAICFALAALYASLITILIEGCITTTIVYLIIKYRKVKNGYGKK